MHKHFTTYTHGDIIYLRTDPEQRPRMVTVIRLTPSQIVYELSCGHESSEHYDIEMSASSDVALKLGIEKEVDRGT